MGGNRVRYGLLQSHRNPHCSGTRRVISLLFKEETNPPLSPMNARMYNEGPYSPPTSHLTFLHPNRARDQLALENPTKSICCLQLPV
ncbi:hypothetical protein CC2G_014092 [Coprinopsis cinerea AmutBmut pab1-1]|nr:hypothetical protein CC2G_014092 [Coprinopsis cinerea AmutBmut pab1-1]